MKQISKIILLFVFALSVSSTLYAQLDDFETLDFPLEGESSIETNTEADFLMDDSFESSADTPVKEKNISSYFIIDNFEDDDLKVEPEWWQFGTFSVKVQAIRVQLKIWA